MAAFQAACSRVGITQSMGRAGSALDNAVIEAWHSTVEFDFVAYTAENLARFERAWQSFSDMARA